jgi:hypothetical protein
VDYNCPEGTGDWVNAHHPSVQVVRVHDISDFSIGKVRNLGAQKVATPWVCFVDSDTLLEPSFLKQVFSTLKDKKYYLAESSTRDLSGVVICATEDFKAIGGYDEVFEGWGCEDNDLYARLGHHGLVQNGVPSGLVSAIAHTDAERTRFHAITDRFLSLRINAMYLQVKTDLAREMRVAQLTQAERQRLYADVKRIVTSNLSAPAHLEIRLPISTPFTAPPGWQLKRRWVYDFDPTAPTNPA